MAWLKKTSQPSVKEELLEEMRRALYRGGKTRLIWVKEKLEKGFPPASTEDLLVLFLISQDIFSEASIKFATSSTRLAVVLAFLTALLVIVAGMDIALRIFKVG